MQNITTPFHSYPKLMHGLAKCSDEERKKHLRHLARTDLYFLLRYLLNRPDIEKKWLFDRCREVQQNSDGYLDLWAREHYKSTIITYGLTIQDILVSHGEGSDGRETTIGIFSHTRPSAKSFLKQIKREFEANAVLKELFDDIIWQNPSKDAPKWSEDEGIILKRKTNPKEATVEAWGLVDGQPIGKHFKTLVYDDVVVPSSVTTPDMIEKTTDAMALSFNLGSEGGTKRFIGTRYHYNDTYKAVIDRQIAKPRVYPCTADGTIEGEPVLLTRERIAEKRREQGPYIFACQMLQDPKADETQGFKEAWLKRFRNNNWDLCNHYILVDPAGEKKKTNDYTVMWCVALCPDGNVRVRDIIRDRLSLTQRAEKLFSWHRKYKPVRNSGVRYEKYGKDADIEHLKSRMEEESYQFEITPVASQVSKNDRIKRLIPYFEQGRILLPDSLNYTDYQGITRDLIRDFIEEEYKAFPVSSHDDMMDSLARLFEPDLSLLWPKEETTQDDYSPPAGSWAAY